MLNTYVKYAPVEVDFGVVGLSTALFERAKECVCEQTGSLLLGHCDAVCSSRLQKRDWLKEIALLINTYK